MSPVRLASVHTDNEFRSASFCCSAKRSAPDLCAPRSKARGWRSRGTSTSGLAHKHEPPITFIYISKTNNCLTHRPDLPFLHTTLSPMVKHSIVARITLRLTRVVVRVSIVGTPTQFGG